MTNLSEIQNSEDMPVGMTFTRKPIQDPFALEKVACGEGTMYPNTCSMCAKKLGSNLDCDNCRDYGEEMFNDAHQSGIL